MKKRAGTAIVAVAATLAVCTATALAGSRAGGLAQLITDADAIVAVEILRTDYRATAADGPMYGDAKVLKVIKGRPALNNTLRFGESGWWGPTYTAGERRILFLKRVTSKEYYSLARWATLHADGIDFFFSMDSIQTLTSASLKSFLEGVQEARRAPLRIEVAQKDDSAKVLSITLINGSNQPIWLNPSRVTAGFEANNIHYSRDVNFADQEHGAWIEIAPAGSITGTLRVASKQVKGTNHIVLWVSHRSVYFPKRCWAGTAKSVPVQVAY